MPTIEIAQDVDTLAELAADKIAKMAQHFIQVHGQFSIVLPGGSTPRRLYQLLALPDVYPVDWNRVQIFFGDERCVPPGHTDSNFNLASEALLSKVPIPTKNIHRMHGEEIPRSGALAYEMTLRQIFPDSQFPSFDLILLGLGEDGHTASLFPDSPALAETRAWVTWVQHTSPPPPLINRLTLTLSTLNSGTNIFFLVAGAGKQKILAKTLFNHDLQPPLPAQLINPVSGKLVWLLDRAAAGQI